LSALGIEHGLELLHHEGDVAAAAEDGRDHARQRHGPGVVLHVLRVDEDFERPPPSAFDDVVDGDVEGVLGVGPAQLVGEARQDRVALQRLGQADDRCAFARDFLHLDGNGLAPDS